ncbi:DUF2752 domain-containing protein [Dyadobacter helix]|uniref:DUF2752 domain-containing protein n=1 Tax=Dyadobacter helix TaxID=2822344 RepID=UPI0038736F2A
MLSSNSRPPLKTVVMVIFSLSAVFVYHQLDPAVYPIGPPCFVHHSTGWLCWGCGGQRAFHQVLHGNFTAAFHLNALIFIVLPLSAIILFSELAGKATIYLWLKRTEVRFLAAGTTLIFTVLRNIL